MALKFRRTLSMEDLQNASDEEMDDLLSSANNDSKSLLKNNDGIGGGGGGGGGNGAIMIRSNVYSENSPDDGDDFFLHGPQAPILNLDNNDGEIVDERSTEYFPRSKSVRFQDEPEGSLMNSSSVNENDRLKQVRVQVEEVTGVMRDNVARLLDREANLDSLADLSEQLHYNSDIYRQSSEHLRRKMWWRQQRTRLVLTAVLIIGICLLFIPIVSKLA